MLQISDFNKILELICGWLEFRQTKNVLLCSLTKCLSISERSESVTKSVTAPGEWGMTRHE